MKIKYKHTNIITSDWQLLSKFYQEVFDCIPLPPERALSGSWLDKGTGIKDAQIEGIHLRLPGYEKEGPTLEILQYSKNLEKLLPEANREGFGHIAFEVDNIHQTSEEVIKHGGTKIGEVSSATIEGVGLLTFIYVADPEGNIIELQTWK